MIKKISSGKKESIKKLNFKNKISLENISYFYGKKKY